MVRRSKASRREGARVCRAWGGHLFALRLLDAVGDLLDALDARHLDDLLLVLEADRAGVHVAALVQVLPRRVDDVAGHLAPRDGIRLRQLAQVLQRPIRQVVEPPRLAELLADRAARQPHVDVGGGVLVHVEPHVLLPAVLDQLLILVFIPSAARSRGSVSSRGREGVRGCAPRGLGHAPAHVGVEPAADLEDEHHAPLQCGAPRPSAAPALAGEEPSAPPAPPRLPAPLLATQRGRFCPASRSAADGAGAGRCWEPRPAHPAAGARARISAGAAVGTAAAIQKVLSQ